MSNLYPVEEFVGSMFSSNNFAGYITNTGVIFNAKLSTDGKIGPPGPVGPPGPQGPEGDVDEDEIVGIVEENTPSLTNADIVRIFNF